MYLAIDAREAFKRKKTGKGAWAHGFIEELKKRNIPLTLLNSSHLQTICSLLRLKPDCCISPTSTIVPALIGKWVPYIVVVHDLIAFQNEPHNFKAKWIERLTLQHALKNAAHICTVSESTKKDLLERFPWVNAAKVSVIYAGPSQPSPLPSPRPTASGRAFKGRGKQAYILCVGTLCPRKNQLRLIEAFKRVMVSPSNHDTQLILAGGRGWHDDDIVKKACETPGVRWLGHVSGEKYRELLESATIFALPSLYEGFGLPVLDAMKAGVPVVISDRGSLREVAGDAAVYIDPEDVDSIAKGLSRLLNDEQLRSELWKKGHTQATKFSWERTVDIFLKAIR